MLGVSNHHHKIKRPNCDHYHPQTRLFSNNTQI
jgi:hypothetical protein